MIPETVPFWSVWGGLFAAAVVIVIAEVVKRFLPKPKPWRIGFAAILPRLVYAEVLGVLAMTFAFVGITATSPLKAVLWLAMTLALALMRRCLLLLLQGELLATVNEPIAEETT